MPTSTSTVAPEHAARMSLEQLLRDAFADDAGVDVMLGHPGEDAAHRNVWVGGVSNGEQQHAFRGELGPSHRADIIVNVHAEVADTGATAAEISTQVWDLAGRIRDAIRQGVTGRHDHGGGIQSRGRVARTRSEGPMPLQPGGYVEQVLVEVAFVAKI